MTEAETFTHNGKTVKLFYDEDAMSPRDADNIGIMLADGHRNYTLGDEEFRKHLPDYDAASEALHSLADEGKIREFPNWCKENLGSTTMLALGLIDHSGISMYVVGGNLIEDPEQREDASHPQDPGGWDSGLVGFIFDTKARREVCGEPTDMVAALKSEVSEYDKFLTGDVYGYVIEDEDGEEEDSCWGFIGHKYAVASAREAAGFTCKHCSKALVRNVGSVMDGNEAPEDDRGLLHTCCATCGDDVEWGGDGWMHLGTQPWDWPEGKPDHVVATVSHRSKCRDGEHFADTDDIIPTY